ncbi:MAG: nucleoside recognition domain-containing protein, partial [Pseudomonadota bacterium]
LRMMARLLAPAMRRLFPEIPTEHPAMGAMIMNISANMLGLGNAATPFGVRAMEALATLTPTTGIATRSMIMFLAINTSCITLFPTGVIALRMAVGSHHAAAIMHTTLVASGCAMVTAIVSVFLLQRWYQASEPEIITPQDYQSDTAPQEQHAAYPAWGVILFLISFAALLIVLTQGGPSASAWVVPCMTMGFLTFGCLRKVAIYEQFVEGAKEGVQVALRIIPYLVTMLVCIGMLRASGALFVIAQFLSPVTNWIGLPAEALPLALMRPLSGSGSYGLLAGLLNDPNIGPDSYIGYLVSTLQGSTETTFYVMAVYFGAVKITKLRYAILAGLLADLGGILGSVLAVRWLLS